MRRLIDANIIGVVTFNPAGVITDANPEFLRMTGYTPEDIQANRVRWNEITPFDLKPLDNIAFQELLLNGRHTPYEKVFIGKDGHRIPVVVGAAFLEDAPDTMTGFVVDITQRKRAETRLSVQFAITRVLAEAATIKEAMPAILQALCESLGWQLGTIWRVESPTGQIRCIESWHAPHVDTQEFETSIFQQTFAPGVGLPGQVWATGKPMWVTDLSSASQFPRAEVAARVGLRAVMGFPILLEQEVLGVIECFSIHSQAPHDDLLQLMTAIGSQIGQYIERKRAEEALQESQKLFQQFMNHSPATAYIKDTEGRFVYCNELLAQSLETSVEQLLGKKHQDFFPPDVSQIWQDHDAQAMATGDRLEHLEVAPLKDGKHYFMSFRFPLRTASGECFLGGMALDISDRIRMEEALRESEARFHMLADKVPVHIWLDDETGHTYYANVRHRDFVQVDAESPLPSWLQVLHPEDAGSYTAQYETARAEQSELHVMARLRRHDGVYRWFEILGLPRLEGDRCVGYVGCSIDITERQQAEAELRRSEQLYRAIGETIDYGIWVCKPDGHSIYVSQAFLDLVGLTHEQFAQQGWGQALHPEDAERTIAAWETCVQAEAMWDIERRFRGVDGRWYSILSRGIPVRDEQGAILYWAGINLDITGLKQVEAELRGSEERFRLAAHAVAGMVYDWDVKTGYVFRSEGLYRLIGMYPDEVNQNAYWWGERMHPDDVATVEALWPALVDGSQDFYKLEYRVRHEDGHWVDVWDQGYIIRDETGQMCRVVGSTADISDRKRAEAERERLLARERAFREEAEQANRMKNEFLAVLSHELRSPLNPILGWTRLLRTHQFDAATTERALDTIERNARWQVQLIENLLDVSRILQGKLRLDSAPVSLAEVVKAAIETLQLAAEAKSITIHTELEPQMPPIMGDANRLQQIIWNLLSNSVKFTPEGGRIDIHLSKVTAAAVASDTPSLTSYVQVEIRDTGRGIRPEFLPHAFEYFRQDDSTITRKFGGLGLGLAIVRHLIELHGGTVQAESPGEDRGATFTLRFPTLKSHRNLQNHQQDPR